MLFLFRVIYRSVIPICPPGLRYHINSWTLKQHHLTSKQHLQTTPVSWGNSKPPKSHFGTHFSTLWVFAHKTAVFSVKKYLFCEGFYYFLTLSTISWVSTVGEVPFLISGTFPHKNHSFENTTWPLNVTSFWAPWALAMFISKTILL